MAGGCKNNPFGREKYFCFNCKCLYFCISAIVQYFIYVKSLCCCCMDSYCVLFVIILHSANFIGASSMILLMLPQ